MNKRVVVLSVLGEKCFVKRVGHIGTGLICKRRIIFEKPVGFELVLRECEDSRQLLHGSHENTVHDL